MITPEQLMQMVREADEGDPDSPRHIKTMAAEILWLYSRLSCLVEMLKRFPEDADPDFPEISQLHGPLWHKVAQMTGLGSTSAKQLCMVLRQDPDHIKLQPEQETDDEGDNHV